MAKDIKVFISSVQREFERERRQLCDYIRTDALLGQFFVPFIFEDLPASEISAQKAYLTQAAECDIYLGIFGTQYGYEEDEKVTKLDEKVSKQEGEKVTELGEKVIERTPESNRVEQKGNRVRLTAKQQKVLEFCDEMPRTAQEILEMIGVKYQTRTVFQYTTKLVLMGVLRPTTTHKNDSNRKYISAHGNDVPEVEEDSKVN